MFLETAVKHDRHISGDSNQTPSPCFWRQQSNTIAIFLETAIKHHRHISGDSKHHRHISGDSKHHRHVSGDSNQTPSPCFWRQQSNTIAMFLVNNKNQFI
ncbi:Hypothetical predicted protein [Pelobates cultripes]|uniref:Uncharacterized protein n=1 Tax=Pelobates cultripes TaxID=61616 RepID=A0AAD1WG85_PELCU|nr:Hypothetical predicted protein [Pelobates cultripes]